MKSNRTHKRIIASVLALGVVLSNAAGIIDGTSIFTDNSITASAADISINAEEITLYGIGRYSSYQLPENYSDSFQLKITGAENVTYRVSDKNTYVKGLNEPYKLVDVSSEGLVTIKEVTNYYNHISIDPSWINYIDVTADGKTFSVPVTVINYSQMLANKIIDDAIQNIINNDMTEYQKMSAICKWIAANTNYSEGGMSYEYILENKVGNCVAHTELVNIMAKKAGLQCWCRYAGGISKGMHRNNMALLDGNYYEIDTSYSGDYWGDASVIKKRNSLFTISTVSGESDATLVSYDENFPENFTIPSTINGYNVKTVFDDFSGGSAYIAEYMVGDDRQQWGVKTLNISEGITTINQNAFTNLSKMETVNIPSTVTNIDSTAFTGCTGLKNINIDSKNTKYSVKDGFLIENENRIIYGYGSRPTNIIIIPDGITSIANLGSYYNSTGYSRRDYYIPASVNEIEYGIEGSYSDRIFGVPGSYAEEYAKAHKLTFIDSTSGIIGTITSSSVQDLAGSFSYTGSEILYNPKVTVDGTVLTKDVDYTVTYNNNTNVGTASYTVTGIGSYDGSVTKTFKISQAEITKSSINISMEDGPFYYTGSAIKPKITITNTVYDSTIKGSKTITLTEGKDYSLNYQQNVNYWDSPYVTITGINNYTGSVKKTFSIEFAVPTPTTTDISTCTATLSSSSYTYDGTAKTPDITVKNGSTTLKEDTDYTVSYSNNVNAGTATAKITGKGSYTGTLSKTYTINKASLGTGTISLSQYSYEYDGAEKKPDVTVKVGSKTLVNGTDYTVTYASNKNAGAATVTATGKGNYSGSMNDTFYITEPEIPEDPEDPKPAVTNISTCTATLSATSYTYDGAAKTPAVTVKNGTTTLTNGTDYTVTYSNNTNAGTATVTITGKGSYTGSSTKTFTIEAASISTATVELSSESYTYDGLTKKPTVTVKVGDKTLVKGTDYSVVYSNSINAGTAVVKVTGKGNYSGTASKDYTINALSISSATVTLSATSYIYDGSAKKPAVTVKLNGKTLTSGTDYSVVYSNNKNVGTATVKVTGKGNYKSVVSKSFKIVPKKTTLKSLKSPKTKQMKVTYSKVSGVTGYQTTYSTSSKFTKKTTKSVNASGTSKTISKLTKGKTYYVKVRTYKTVKGTKYYSAYSSVKKVKVK